MNALRLIPTLAFAVALTVPTPSDARQPNVIVFLVDDLGWTDLACYGSETYQTPNIDRLASEGLRFTDAYSACTVCSPTRAALMTGQYPARLRVTDWIAGHQRPWAKMKVPDWTMELEHRHLTLAEAFKKAGYRTANIGKWHLGEPTHYPEHQGFDVNIAGMHRGSPPGGYHLPNQLDLPEAEKGEYLTDHLADQAAKLITRWKDDPFLLYFPFYNVHTPIQGRKDLVEKYEASIAEGAHHDNPAYAAMVESMDEAIGRVDKTLESLGLKNDTVIIFTSDNGGLSDIARGGPPLVPTGITDNAPLRLGKGSAYEGGVRVPCIVRWPRVTKAGTTTSIPACSIDFFPTLVGQLTEVPIPDDVDGIDLTPVLENPSGASLAKRNLFWHYPHYHPGSATPYSAIRSGDWRLLEFFEDGKLELYNLSNDIGETQNLVGSQSEKAAELHAKLKAWRQSVSAQLPIANPDFDPERQFKSPRKKDRNKKPTPKKKAA